MVAAACGMVLVAAGSSARAQTAPPASTAGGPAAGAARPNADRAPPAATGGTATGGTVLTPEKEEAALSPAALPDEEPRYPPPSTRWKTAGTGVLVTGAFY